MTATAARKTLSLDVYGTTVGIDSTHAETLDELQRDFSFFRTAGDSARIRLTLHLASPPPPSRARGLRWKGCRILDEDGRRILDYEDRARCVYNFGSESGIIHASDPHLLHELAYLTVHSRAGLALDRRGLHRVHALGFSWRGNGGLLLLPKGGGKTCLALELMRSLEGFRLLSDDMPLLGRDGRLRAFPSRLGLREHPGSRVPGRWVRPFRRRRHGLKHLVDLDFFRKHIAREAPLKWIIAGSAAADRPPRIAACSYARASAALAWGLVAGSGIPQVLELLLPPPPRLPGVRNLVTIAASRARSAARALREAKRFRFLLGRNAQANAAALADRLRRT